MDKVYIVAGNKHQYAIFLLMAEVHPKDFPYLERKSQLLGMQDFKYPYSDTLFSRGSPAVFYMRDTHSDWVLESIGPVMEGF